MTSTRPPSRSPGPVPRSVTLRPPDWSLRPGRAGAPRHPRTRLLLLNSPAQPDRQGVHRRRAERASPRVCQEHDLIVVTDEVYEHIVFDGAHVPLASLPGMRERTVTICVGRQDVLVHRMEGGLGVRPAPL